MAFEQLPTNYKDAVWSGLKRYNEINNEDGTVSFQDVTAYSNKEESFFGAKDANRMNEALNYIMSALENGTDLYKVFQDYFTAQKTAFTNTSNQTLADFNEDLNGYKNDVEADVGSIKADAQNEFIEWFNLIKGQLSEDAAGSLQVQVNNVSDRLKTVPNFKIDTMIIKNTQWVDSGLGYYTYEFAYMLDNNAKVDIQLDVNAIDTLTYSGSTAMYAENLTNNRIRIYCVGKAPRSSINIQLSIMGVPTT